MPDPRFFKTIEPKTLRELAEISGCFLNDQSYADKTIKNVASINSACSDEITFLSNSKYAEQLLTSKAGACILEEKYIDKAPVSLAILVSKQPYLAYAKIAAVLHPQEDEASYISDKAVINNSAIIGKNCTIEPGVVVGPNVQIGDNCFIGANTVLTKGIIIGNNCKIYSNVTLSHTIIGNDVIIFPGAKIGQDGFGFATDKGRHIKIPQLGRVIIGNDVEVGANCCIDRGAGPDTIIGDGTRIDNLVQIGHNVEIGRGCIIVSQVGISGSTKLGDYVVLGGQVGIAGHLHIGSGSNVAAQSGIMRDIAPKEVIGGSPGLPIKQWHRQNVIIQKLISKKG